MKKIPLEIIIPIYNEGEKVIKLLEFFQKSIKTEFRVLFCYDLDNDNIFNFKTELEKFSFEIVPVSRNSNSISRDLYKILVNYFSH